MSLSRRDFLNRSAVVGGGMALVGSTQMLLTAPGAAAAQNGRPPRPAGYGPLVADPAGELALPAGFSYQIVTRAGSTRLESGHYTPSNHDGTGAFHRRGGGTVLVNNHELGGALADTPLPVPHLPGCVYDPATPGGCTVVETDQHGRRVREWVGIAGTHSNCAGGVTPWKTWLTCEETETKAGGDGATGAMKDHGYVFEVDPFDQRSNRDPRPVKALGRFAHEAVAVDPTHGHLYLTEDAAGPNGLLYRWEPPRGWRGRRGALRELGPTAGTLAAMTCLDASGRHVDDLSRATEVGTTYQVRWTPVPDRDATSVSVRAQLTDSDVTRGRKLEGIWWGDGGAWVVSSFARSESPVPHDGQIWFLDPRRGRLTLRLRFGLNPNPDQEGAFDGPDNISVSPWGGVIVAEDGEGLSHLFGATEDGRTFPLARNERDTTEFTGPVFSPDHRVLFANIQVPGTMFAITGPWRHQSRQGR